MLSTPPPLSTPEKVKQSKAKPAESASSVVIPPSHCAETAKLTSPLAVVESNKDTANEALAPVGAIGTDSTKVVVNAVVNTAVVHTEVNGEESLEGEEVDEGFSSKGSDSSGEESEQDENEKEPESDADDGSVDDDVYNPNKNVFDRQEVSS